MKKTLLILLALLVGCGTLQAGTTTIATLPDSVVAQRWVDSVMSQLTLQQQVAQLMVVRVPLNMNKKEAKKFERLLRDTEVGGVCFFVGTAAQQVEQTRRYQQQARVPLLVCLDAEWGLGMRLKDCYSFPRQMMLGAMPDSANYLIGSMGDAIARQCRQIGVHVNFAPVADLNSNPANPVIGSRSFGMNRERASLKGIQYFQALQRQRVMTSAKHFPGHGDTDVDSHEDLPVISHSRAEIDSIDSYPFRRMAQEGLMGVMIAHLQVDALDDTRNTPSTLSPQIIGQPAGTPYCAAIDNRGGYNGYLRSDLGFNGIVFTDGMDMKGVTKHYKNGRAELKALQAGVDVLLLPPDVKAAIAAIVAAATRDEELAAVVEHTCRRVLAMKYWCGLAGMNVAGLQVPTEEQNKACYAISRAMAQRAATLIQDRASLLPLQPEDNVLRLPLGYGDSTLKSLDATMIKQVQAADKVLLSLYCNTDPTSRRNYGIDEATRAMIDTVCQHNRHTVLVIYGSPFALQYWPRVERDEEMLGAPSTIVVAYENLPETQEALQPLLYGKATFVGALPVAAANYAEGYRYQPPARDTVNPYGRLKAAGMKESCFQAIDSVVLRGIAAHAYPGAQLLVAKGGRIVYNRAYGHQSYDPAGAVVDTTTLYDVASLTKVAATTMAVMKLYEAGKIGLDDKLSRYLPYLKHTNKKNITIRQALSHIARLKAFDPSYWKAVDPDCMDRSMPEQADVDCDDCKRTVLQQIVESKPVGKNRYVYSDLGFILLGDMVERVSGQTLDLFVRQQFYEPLGMTHTMFRPLQHGVDSNDIAPTELATDSRARLLRGEVHDPTAAAMGGVAGHAGLFSTATDLAQLYLMMLNEGHSGERAYLKRSTLHTFNTQYYLKYGNRRGLGFDKPKASPGGHTAPEVSASSYGHTGFTGTMVWVDPDYDLVYIFLSNRVHPDSKDNKLAKMNIRTDIQSLIYQSFLGNESTENIH